VPRFEIGDVFRLPIDSNRVGFGQIVGKYGRDAYYFAIFELPHTVEEPVDIPSLVEGEISLLALSLDALLVRGDWEIIGRTEPPPLRWPIYQEAVAPDIFDAVDYTGNERRPISEREASSLPTRSIVAPIRVQNAFQALHGAGPWQDAYDRLRY
jgi:Immunity protein 26